MQEMVYGPRCRSEHLSAEQREIALELRGSLQSLRSGFYGGEALDRLEAVAVTRLAKAGFEVDYVEIRRRQDLLRPNATDRDSLVALAAARLGQTRLIDNLELDDLDD